MSITVLPTLPFPAITANSIFTTGSLGNIGVGAAGASGAYYISGGSGASSWSNYNYTTAMNTISIVPTTTNPGLQVKAEGLLEIKGDDADIRINGKSMNKWMEQVEQRLNILSPNPELEKEWDELLELGNRYRALEADIKDKMQMWDLLKKEY